jgi:hypothetical protein
MVAVNPGGSASQPEVSAAVKTKSRLCGLLVRSAGDVQIVGRATVRFIGSRPGLARTDTFTSFTTPDRPTDEWAAVRAALGTFLPDGQDVQRRLERLQADACSPLPPGCALPALAAHLETALREPSTRFRTLRELFDGDRSLARFVRLLGLAVIRDGLDSEELNLLQALLEPARPDVQVERALPESAQR